MECYLIKSQHEKNRIQLQNKYKRIGQKCNLFKQKYDNNNSSWNCKYNLLNAAMNCQKRKYIQLESDYEIINAKHTSLQIEYKEYYALMQKKIFEQTQTRNQLNNRYLINEKCWNIERNKLMKQCKTLFQNNNDKSMQYNSLQQQFDDLNDNFNHEH